MDIPKLTSRWCWRGVFTFYLVHRDGSVQRVVVPNEITADGLQHTVQLWAGEVTQEFDLLRVEDEAGTEYAEKTPAQEVLTAQLRQTVMFDHDEANFHIRRVQLYAGTVLVAETAVDIIKSDDQSLTVQRDDYLQEGAT